MNSFLKKKLAVLLSTVMCVSASIVPAVSANGLDAVVADVGYAYEYVDTNDVGTIATANAKAAGVVASDVTDEGIDLLMTDAFTGLYDSQNEAKEALVSLIVNSLSIYYSTSVDTFETNAIGAEDAIEVVAGKIGTTAEEWVGLMINSRKESQEIADSREKIVWAFGSMSGNTDALTELYKTVDDLQVRAMGEMLETTMYANLKSALDVLGWTPDSILAGVRAVSKVADPYKAAEFALIKAAARSGTELYIDGQKMDVPAETTVFWDSNIYKISPDELPIEKTIKIKVIGDERATNAAGYYVSDESMVSITPNQANKELVIAINDTASGLIDIVIKRDPYGDNTGSNDDWLLRQRIVVAYTLSAATAPVWGTDADEGVISWEEVEHATKYEVTIYKNGEAIETVEVTTNSYDANEVLATNGNGEYTADVIAIGSNEYEIAAPSPVSAPYAYSNSLDTPDAPVWTDMVLSWDPVNDATSYVVYLYRNDATEPFKMIPVTDTSYDATDDLDGMEGTFYAAVKAKKDTLSSALSAKSEPLKIVFTYDITGSVKLESYNRRNPNAVVYQADNSGINVTVKVTVDGQTQTVTAVTDESGAYSLAGLPNGKHKVTFEHPTKPFLKRIAEVEVNNSNAKEDVMLYYGDLSDGMGEMINPLDISSLVYRLGDETKYDVIFDIEGDGVIGGTELQVLLRNFKKNTSSK